VLGKKLRFIGHEEQRCGSLAPIGPDSILNLLCEPIELGNANRVFAGQLLGDSRDRKEKKS
jgi:hypothetical protein